MMAAAETAMTKRDLRKNVRRIVSSFDTVRESTPRSGSSREVKCFGWLETQPQPLVPVCSGDRTRKERELANINCIDAGKAPCDGRQFWSAVACQRFGARRQVAAL